MMEETQGQSLSEKTLLGIREIVDRVLDRTHGIERTMVTSALRALYPTIENRIRNTPDEELMAELKHVQGLLASILETPKQKKPAAKRTRKAPHRKNEQRSNVTKPELRTKRQVSRKT